MPDSDEQRDAYRALRGERPELFRDGGLGSIEILSDRDASSSADALDPPPGVMYADQYVVLLRDRVRFPGGVRGTYIRLVAPDNAPGVVVLPSLGDRVVLVRHFRHATRAWHWEAPRGFRDPSDASAEAAARRELEEEIGAPASTMTSMGVMHPDTGLSDGHVDLFHASVDSVGELDATEGLAEARLVTLVALEAMILDGTLTDGFTLAAFTSARLRGLI